MLKDSNHTRIEKFNWVYNKNEDPDIITPYVRVQYIDNQYKTVQLFDFKNNKSYRMTFGEFKNSKYLKYKSS